MKLMLQTAWSLIRAAFLPCSLLASLHGAEFVPLFDGKTLAGWDGDPRFWRVEDGAIVGETTAEVPTQGNTFLVWQGGEVADFELKIKFRLRNHNSGIQYRSFVLGDDPWRIGGYQADFSADNQWTGAAWGERYKKMLATRGHKTVVGETENDKTNVALLGDDAEILAAVRTDDWNEYHIIARGNHCLQFINGVLTAEFSESSEERLSKGLIALQLHGGPPMEVRFKDIELRVLEPEDKKEILFLAGKNSHAPGAHEHHAGCHLLARSLNESGLDVIAQVVTEGAWPEPWVGYDKPDAVVMYCDGYTHHMALEHQERLARLTEAGVGVACIHFATEVEPDKLGDTFLDWLGGYFSVNWSVNPHWTASFESLPDHPVANGVRPFSILDEWYYHLRFRPDMEGVTPILSALPQLETLTKRAADPLRGSNPAVMEAVQEGEPQVVAWASVHPETMGRGFGFTGGHFHKNWQHDDFRKVVLNGLYWTAGGTVPPNGVPSRTPSDLDLLLNQKAPKP
ncbi:MAG: hypothetical protein RL648_330 [Verrucomicrobiota bacterium]